MPRRSDSPNELTPFGLRRLSASQRKAALLALFGISLAGCLGLRAVTSTAAFYLMPTRLWELLAGALVAKRVIPSLRAPWLAEAVAGVALVGLGVAISLLSDATPHPGLLTLLPCPATAALIHAGSSRQDLTNRLLGSRPLAAIGSWVYLFGRCWSSGASRAGRGLRRPRSPQGGRFAGRLGALLALCRGAV